MAARSVIVGACVGIVSALFLTPGEVSAGNPNLCHAAEACIYANNNFVGLLDKMTGGTRVRTVSSVDNDKMDSWENRTNRRGAWYHDANGGGDCVTMEAGREDNNINVFDSDELTSWGMNQGC